MGWRAATAGAGGRVLQAWNHVGSSDDGAAVTELAEAMVNHPTLALVDLTANRISEEAASVFADALTRSNGPLERLRLDENPVGTLGGASLILAEGRRAEQGRPVMISLRGCSFMEPTHRHFDVDNPAGLYRLDLSKPLERLIAVQLQVRRGAPFPAAAPASTSLAAGLSAVLCLPLTARRGAGRRGAGP